jgi:hypothetical protein
LNKELQELFTRYQIPNQAGFGADIFNQVYAMEPVIWEGMAVALAYNWQVAEGCLMMQEGFLKQEETLLQGIADRTPLLLKPLLGAFLKEQGAKLHSEMRTIVIDRTYHEVYSRSREHFENRMASEERITVDVETEVPTVG